MYSTLQSLYRIFPHLLVGRDVVLTGESYAGHYIPAMADYFLALNDALTNPSVGPGHVLSNPNGDVAIPVVSIAIGNGWSIPRIQYNYAEFARNMGIISSPDADRLTTQYRACLDQQRRGDFRGSRACNIIGQVLAASGACPFQSSIAADDELDDDTYSQSETDDGDDSSACYGPVVNYYDVRLYADIGSVWPDTDTITATYLNLPEVRAAIHVQGNTNPFEECNRAGSRLALMDGLGVETQIVRLLERGVPMTFYSGQYDLVCNHMGNEQMLDQLKWSGADDFRSARGFVWTLLGQSPTGIKVSSPTSRDSSTSDNSDSGHGNHSKGADVSAEVPPLSTASNSKTASLPSVPTAPQRRVPAGYGRSTADGRLTFLVVIGASHMVPYDVPASAQDIIKRVVRKRSFADYTQKMTFNRTTARRSDTVSAKTVIDELKRDASSILVSLTQLPYPTHYVLFAGVLVFICTYSCVRACCCGPRRRHNDALYSRGSQHIYVELPQ
jgi:carboxypeptidase C (cathepsin A)